jgi:hypothetical protein
MPFGEHQTRLLIFFFKQWLFFLLLFSNAQLRVLLKVVLWTDTPISAVELRSSFGVIFGLFVASLLNAHLAWSEFWWAALSWQVCCGAIFFPLFNNGFNGARGMFKVSDIFL